MKRKFGYVVLLALLLTGCKTTVLEFPENGGVDPTLVNVELTLAVDPSIEPYAATSGRETKAQDEYDVRWIVEVFRDEIAGDPVARRVLSCDPMSDGNHTIETSFALHAAKYVVVAWMDYVDDGSTDDKYYAVPSLETIHILEGDDYVGDEDHKDTYVGREEIDLTGYRDLWNETVQHSMTLERPMAKIEFIATDVVKLLKELAAQRLELQGVVSDNLLSENPDLSAIRVSVNYGGYFPSGFNVYTNKPNDATQGVSFECAMTPLSDQEARLCSDYVFVNGSESAVSVSLTIRDDEGNVLNDVGNVSVPIVRGKLTTIRDEFLTQNFVPGIGINPDFDGEIDVVIPD